MIEWLDIVDQNQLHKLLSANNLQLNYSTRAFLESFARLVNRASTTYHRLVNAAVARKFDLHTVNSVIADEISHLQTHYPLARLIPYRHPETSLPILYVRLQAVPDLVVHVFRSYANTRRGLAFGFRAHSFCRGRLTGPLARAANYLTTRCAAKDWNLSVSELISLWCQQVEAIPIHERRTSITPRNKPVKKMRRRRQQKPSSPPPTAEDDIYHASVPQDHPKMDVVIKDDKLFPNRVFENHEQLYAEQIRAIRNKRKPSPGSLDNYELACKRRRPHIPKDSSSQQTSLKPPPVPLAKPNSLSPPLDDREESSTIQHHAPTPFQASASADKPSEPDNHPPSVPELPESVEEPSISFKNPFSPEMKDSLDGESPQSPPPTEAQTEHALLAVQEAAKMEDAERAVLSTPAEGPNTASPQPPHAVTHEDPDDPDDNAQPVFVFSTGLDPHLPSNRNETSLNVPVTDEEIRGEIAVTSPRHEEAGHEKFVPSPQKGEETSEADKPSMKKEPELSSDEGKDPSALEKQVGDAELKTPFPPQNDDDEYPQHDETAKPSIAHEGTSASGEILDELIFVEKDIVKDIVNNWGVSPMEEPHKACEGPEGAEGLAEQDLADDESMEPQLETLPLSGPVSDMLENPAAVNTGSKKETAAAISTSAVFAGLPSVAEPDESDSLPSSPLRKRDRELDESADVSIVDPSPEEERRHTRSAKKRKLSSSFKKDEVVEGEERTAEETHLDARRNQEGTLRGWRTAQHGAVSEDEAQLEDSAPFEDSALVEDDARKEREILAEDLKGSKEETLSDKRPGDERSSPREVSTWTTELSQGSPSVGTPVRDVIDSGIKDAKDERNVTHPKEVTSDIEYHRTRIANFDDVATPPGVDRDPCPMALSEPSEASEESGDSNSNSEGDSVLDDAAPIEGR